MRTDQESKQLLAKMLPEKVEIQWQGGDLDWLVWRLSGVPVFDTELLHLCWLVEQALDTGKRGTYRTALFYHIRDCGEIKGYGNSICHATWQQRIIALAKVKGIEV